MFKTGRGGIEFVFEFDASPNNYSLHVKLKDKYFKPVLLRKDIHLVFKQDKNLVYITATGYEEIPVPNTIIKQASFERGIFDVDMRNLEDIVIDLCIQQAIFYHPMEEMIPLINF